MHVLALIIEGACEQARRGRLADPADAGEHEGMRDAAGLERVGQRADHRLLADEILEPGRPVLPGQHLIGCRPNRDIIAKHRRRQRVARLGDIVFGALRGQVWGLLRGHDPYMAHGAGISQPEAATAQIPLWNRVLASVEMP
jgi:hypothetical protein